MFHVFLILFKYMEHLKNIADFFLNYSNSPHTIEDEINLILVILRIRTGTLLNMDIRKIEHFNHLSEMFPIYGKEQYTHGIHSNFIICHKDDIERCKKIDEIVSMKDVIYSGDPAIVAKYDILTGEILGYFTPMSLRAPRELTHRCDITITLHNIKGKYTYNVSVFPQIINGPITKEMTETLETMVEQIKSHSDLLPDQFVNVEYSIIPTSQMPSMLTSRTELSLEHLRLPFEVHSVPSEPSELHKLNDSDDLYAGKKIQTKRKKRKKRKTKRK